MFTVLSGYQSLSSAVCGVSTVGWGDGGGGGRVGGVGGGSVGAGWSDSGVRAARDGNSDSSNGEDGLHFIVTY